MTAIGPSDHMRNHWWWRPGWRVGRRIYTWHVTFSGQRALHRLARNYRDALAPLPGLDLIPEQWLHLTMQGIGFTDEISGQDITDIAEAARKRLAAQPPVAVTAGPAVVDPEAVVLTVHRADSLDPVRAAVRAAIADVRGAANVPESEEWTPHISVAYSNSDGPAGPYIDAIGPVTPRTEKVSVTSVQLIQLGRDTRLYQWTTKADVPLSG
jgi:2'-5' RNA ligase